MPGQVATCSRGPNWSILATFDTFRRPRNLVPLQRLGENLARRSLFSLGTITVCSRWTWRTNSLSRSLALSSSFPFPLLWFLHRKTAGGRKGTHEKRGRDGEGRIVGDQQFPSSPRSPPLQPAAVRISKERSGTRQDSERRGRPRTQREKQGTERREPLKPSIKRAREEWAYEQGGILGRRVHSVLHAASGVCVYR